MKAMRVDTTISVLFSQVVFTITSYFTHYMKVFTRTNIAYISN